MGGTAAKNSKFYLSTTDVAVGALTSAEVVPTNDISLDSQTNLLEDTSHGGDGARSRVAGLTDASFSINIFLNPGNAKTLELMQAQLDGTPYYAYYMPTGASTFVYKGKVLVESVGTGSPVDDMATLDVSLQATQKLTLTTA